MFGVTSITLSVWSLLYWNNDTIMNKQIKYVFI